MFGTFHKDYTLSSFTPSRRTMATAMIITSTIFRCHLKSVRGDMVGICKQTTEYCINAHLCKKKFVKFKIKTFQQIFLLSFTVYCRRSFKHGIARCSGKTSASKINQNSGWFDFC